jgi:hypothetical protein
MIVGGLNADFDGDHQIASYIKTRIDLTRMVDFIESQAQLSTSIKNFIFLLLNTDTYDKIPSYDITKEELIVKVKEKILFLQKNEQSQYVPVVIPIEEFPHDSTPFKIEGACRQYNVPDGVEVVSIDATGNYKLRPATVYTAIDELELHHVEYERHGVVYASKDKTILIADPETYNLRYIETKQSGGHLTPYLVNTKVGEEGTYPILYRKVDLSYWDQYQSATTERGTHLYTTDIDCDRDLGYVFGAIIGDGSLSRKAPYMIQFSNSDANIVEKMDRILNRYFEAKHSSYACPH